MSTQRVEVTRFKAAAADGSPSPPPSPSAAGAQPASRSPSLPHRAGSLAAAARFSDHDEHLYFWMPLLIGLTELTFDPREALRISALDVLFDTLTEHGACFSEGFWAKVFERMLLPIFDSVQVDDVDFATFSARASDEASRDRWLYETCSHCLHHLINIIVKFYPLVHSQLPKARTAPLRAGCSGAPNVCVMMRARRLDAPCRCWSRLRRSCCARTTASRAWASPPWSASYRAAARR